MRMLLPLLLMSLMMPCALLAQDSPQPQPLTPEEKRQILGQLLELRSCREEVRAYEQYIQREANQDEREKANVNRALELERRATNLAEGERDLALEKAALYEQLYKSLAKKPSLGCRILRVLTLGIRRCK